MSSYKKCTVAELRQLCDEKGIDFESCRTKRELIQAIEQYDMQNDNLIEEVDETMLNGQNVEEEDGDVETEMDDEGGRDDDVIINETLRVGRSTAFTTRLSARTVKVARKSMHGR